MQKPVAGLLGILLALLVAMPFCVDIRAELAGGSDEQASMTTPATPKKKRASTWPPKRLQWRQFDVGARPVPVEANRVAFLPMLNLGRHRIHATYLDAVSTTLAAHASLHQGRQIVAPEHLEAILRKEGPPTWFALPNHFRYTPPLLERIRDATGAGVIVWASVEDDGGITLQAEAMAEGADPSPWQNVTLEAGGPLDLQLFDAPRALLERMRSNESESLESTPPAPSPQDMAMHESALAHFSAGDPASVYLAEQELAHLAASRPSWPAPLVELSVLRVTRALLFEPHAIHALMNEGPLAPRHLARSIPGLTEAQRTSLDWVDHFYVGHLRSDAELTAMIERLPPASIERALLALFHATQDVARFDLEPIVDRGVLGQVVYELASQPGPNARREYAAKRIGMRDPIAFATPVLLSHARLHFDDVNDWGGERLTWQVGTIYAVPQALETLRLACADLPEGTSDAVACHRSLARFVHELAPDHPIGPPDLGDPAKWDAAVAEVAQRVVTGWIPTKPRHPVPGEIWNVEDPSFPGHWYAIHLLARTANEVFSRRDRASLEILRPGELLTARDRQRLVRSLDWLLMAAYQPAVVGMHRSQRDEYEPYADALRGLSQQYELDMAFRMRHELDVELGRKFPHALALNSLGSRHPFHPDYLYSYAASAGKKMSRGLADWLGVLVPLPPVLSSQVMNFRVDAGERDAVVAELEPALARRQNSGLARSLETALTRDPADWKRGFAALDAAVTAFPYDDSLLERSAWVAVEAGELEIAEERFTRLTRDASDLAEACFGLAQIARRRDELSVAEKILVSCADRAQNKWERHSLMIRVANMQRDEGRYAEAIESIERASKGIGSSGAVLESWAASLALMGELDRSAAFWEKDWKLYRSAGGWDSAVDLAELELLRGNLDRAAQIFDELYADENKHGGKLLELGQKIAMAQGDLAGFQKLCRRTGDRGLLPLARFQWKILRDADAALATLAEMEKVWPDSDSAALLRAEILLARREFEDVLSLRRRFQQSQPDSDWQRLEIEALLAVGKHSEVQSRVRDRMARDRWTISTWELRARLEIAQGKTDAARATLNWATRALRQPGIGDWQTWWLEIRPLLLLETELIGKAGDRAGDVRLETLLARAAKRLPHDPELWSALARVRDGLGRTNSAGEARRNLARIWPQHPDLPGRTEVPAAPADQKLVI